MDRPVGVLANRKDISIPASAVRTSRRSALAFSHLPAKYVIDDADDRTRFLACQPVIDSLAVAPRRNESVGTEACELLRHCRLPQVEQIFQLTHSFLAFSQNAQDHQPAFMSQRF